MPAITLPDPPRIILAVGLPGCGKSTWLARQRSQPISSDAIRLQLSDNENDQAIHARVFATVRYVLQQRIEIGRPETFIDATNLTRRERSPYIEMARKHKCRIEALWFDVPIDTCRARNAARNRIVPTHVMDLMAAKFVPPSASEGFASIATIPAVTAS